MSTSALPHLVLCELEDPGMLGLESLSPFCLKVHCALRLAGLPYERRHGRAPRDFREHNPTGQVPVLLMDGHAVPDSTAILKRVVDLAPDAFDAGADLRALGERWLWEELADASLNGYVVAARWADARNWPAVSTAYFGRAPWFVRSFVVPRIRAHVLESLVSRDIWRAGENACWKRFGDTLDDLEARAPVSGYWLGRAPGVADISIFAQLASLRTPLTAFQAREIEKRPRLVDWIDRVDHATRAEAAVPRLAVKQQRPNGAPAPLVEHALS
jgi:glutathione S-transferase